MATKAIVKESVMWNLWHDCHKLSPGCKHCYVYRGDTKRDVDSSVVTQTKNFDLPVRKKRNGEYKVSSRTLVYTCFTSYQCLPEDWGDGYENVTICYTVKNQACVDYRLPIYKTAPIKHKIIICEPLLEKINLRPFNIGERIEQVVVEGKLYPIKRQLQN